MLGELLRRVSTLISSGDGDKTKLPELHPLRAYFEEGGNTLLNYLALDDFTVWGSLPILERSDCSFVSDLAYGLRHRKLYKCFDVGAKSKEIGGDCELRFRKLLKDSPLGAIDVLEDIESVSPYKHVKFESANALSKIVIRRPDGSGRHEDVAKISPVVNSLGEEKIFRFYSRDDDVKAQLETIWEDVKR